MKIKKTILLVASISVIVSCVGCLFQIRDKYDEVEDLLFDIPLGEEMLVSKKRDPWGRFYAVIQTNKTEVIIKSCGADKNNPNDDIYFKRTYDPSIDAIDEHGKEGNPFSVYQQIIFQKGKDKRVHSSIIEVE